MKRNRPAPVQATKGGAPLQFERESSGGWVVAPGGVDPQTLRIHVINAVARHPAFDLWARDCAEATGMAVLITRDPVPPAGPLRDRIQALGLAAHTMRNKLVPLAVGRDDAAVFDALEPLAEYVFLRARQPNGQAPDRPAVPHVQTSARTLAEMTERLVRDLDALRLLCEHQADKMTNLPASRPAYWERWLVQQVAAAYRTRFGKLPPRRSWFGDAFMPHLGRCAGLDIGHRIVGEVVADMA